MAGNHTLQVIRIAALLAVIFAAGIIIGRNTAPDPAPIIIHPAPPGASVEKAVSIMSRRYFFDEEKEERFRALMVRMEKDMRAHEPGTPGRWEVRRRYLPEIRTFVPEDMMDIFEAQIERGDRRLEREIRERDAAQEAE